MQKVTLWCNPCPQCGQKTPTKGCLCENVIPEIEFPDVIDGSIDRTLYGYGAYIIDWEKVSASLGHHVMRGGLVFFDQETGEVL